MQALVGLFLFSLLLTTGVSLECEECIAVGTSCSGKKTTCTDAQDTCITIVGESTFVGVTSTSTVKSCYSQEGCNQLKAGTDLTISGISLKIKELACKAPAPSASLLLALSGLLLLKLLF